MLPSRISSEINSDEDSMNLNGNMIQSENLRKFKILETDIPASNVEKTSKNILEFKSSDNLW